MPTLPPIEGAIAIAESILPGKKAPPGQIDLRWQAVILVGAYIETHPVEVCDFAIRWLKHRSRDLQSAINCCLIEHLLEYHFDLLFPRIRGAALKDPKVAEHFYPYSPYFQFGQAELPKNVARLKRLASELRKKWSTNPHFARKSL